jgi:hypothetical protein
MPLLSLTAILEDWADDGIGQPSSALVLSRDTSLLNTSYPIPVATLRSLLILEAHVAAARGE